MRYSKMGRICNEWCELQDEFSHGQAQSKTKFDEGWLDTSFLTEEWFRNKLK
ncbi:hypothetical protein [Clostridium botulinum]|uniref:hypothetical protein n=1 Tax=Clostridium botulinum TaxID=1491 RepID=UPI00138EFB00|nr:hypothetical protein [Clostridium botulinum]